jgi:excinuclease ABC subunit C
MIDIKAFLSNATNHPGVYQMLGDDGEILYVGKAKNLKKRLTSYFNASVKDIKTQAMVSHIKDIGITVTRNENEALILESNLIKKHRPRYNVLFRDDKSYPYIHITNEEPYPRIDFYRGAIKKDGQYFGPYPSAQAVRETIHLIQKVFKLRTCADNFFSSRARPCLHHQIGMCSGSCAGLISPEEYLINVRHAVLFLQGKNQEILEELSKQMETAATTKNYELAALVRDQIMKMRAIQDKQYVTGEKGDADIISLAINSGIVCIQLLVIRHGRILGSRSHFPKLPPHTSTEEIMKAFILHHYVGAQGHDLPKEIIIDNKLPEQAVLVDVLTEQAKHKVTITHSVRGERKKWQEMAAASASLSIGSQMANKANTKERLAALQKLLNLPQPPTRIECFDISHSMGEATVASCVVFKTEGAAKSDYRRYNISGITPGDDTAAMRQALTRRFKHPPTEERKLPDILLIDGGLPQLHAAEAVLKEAELFEKIILIGVAKGAGRKPGLETLHFSNQPPLNLTSDSHALHLIQQIRDEAHRFAITAHRNRRDKKRRTSTLESIPGIGAKRRRELLRYFGGIQAINRASLDEIAKVPGISRPLAQKIFESLHNVAV